MPLEPKPMMIKPEANLHTPSIIHIYAIDTTQTTADHVTAQGFGYSSPLKQPIHHTSYRWEGSLHPNEYERNNPKSREGYQGAFNVRDTLPSLAENFAEQYRSRQDPVLQTASKSSYLLEFEPPPEDKNAPIKFNPEGTPRKLTLTEQNLFIKEFQDANRKAVDEKFKRS